LRGSVIERLADEIDEIYHSAAIAEFRVPLNDIRKVNVNGVNNIMEFATLCSKNGKTIRVNHVSTAYVAGTFRGLFNENDLDIGQKFNNTYEQSKYEAESVINAYRMKGLKVTIFRPGILTGDSQTGRTSNYKMLYQPLRFFSEELYSAIPANKDANENLIPVDVAAKEIITIANDSKSAGATYNITNPTPLKAGHFVDVASKYFGFRKPDFIPVEKFDMATLTYVQRILIEPFVPYFNYNPLFDTSNSTKILNTYNYKCPSIDDNMLLRLFRYCVESGFIKRKRNSVVAR